MEGAWDSVEAITYDPHLRDTPPESSVNTQRAVSQDIDQRIRPTVVQAGANITLEDCEDTTVVYLPCEQIRRKLNTRLRFSQ